MKCKHLWLALATLAACEHPSAIDRPTVIKRMPSNPDLDVLFVIDNSPSTADKQALFAQNFTALATALDQSMDGRPNLHIGVVTTTVGTGSDVNLGFGCPKTAPQDDGLLVNSPRVAQCAGPQGRYLEDVGDEDGNRTTNYQGSLAEAFSCIAQVGDTGCGYEAPLEAMKRALDGSRPENDGFLRPDADLAIVLLADEDDASVADPSIFSLNNVGPGDFRAQPLYAYDCDQAISADTPGNYTNCRPHHGGYLSDPPAYAQFLGTLKNPSQTMVAVIAGDPTPSIATGVLDVPVATPLGLEPSCQTTILGHPAIARPGLRLDEFRQQFGERGGYQSVCQSDYTPALQHIAGDMVAMMGPCIDGDIGSQPDCVVTESAHFGTPQHVDTLMPACAVADNGSPTPDGPRPCWWLQASPTCTSSGFALHVERTVPAAAGSLVEARCAAAQ
jgi:hypothetical protein